MPNEISAKLAIKIHREKGLAYTPTDKFDNGTYVPHLKRLLPAP